MLKFLRSIKLFYDYKKAIKINKKYLGEKYGLNVDNINRLWTVLDLSDMPPEIVKQYGAGVMEMEYNKYIATFNADLFRLDLNELVVMYDLKNISKTQLGITFGYSQFNNAYFYIAKWAIITLLSLIVIIGLMLIIF